MPASAGSWAREEQDTWMAGTQALALLSVASQAHYQATGSEVEAEADPRQQL